MRESKRLFVGNLPPNVTDDDLVNEFSAYGKVLSVDIKTKEGNTNSDKSNKFGFVNIEIDDYMSRQCIQEFRDTAYKGYYLTVSVAKESFLDKLKREREEASQLEAKKQEEAKRPKVHEVESEEFVIKPSKFKAEPVHCSLGEDGDTAFQRRSKGAYFENGKVKILGGTGAVLHADPTFDHQDPTNEVAAESNKKRLQSLKNLKQAHDKQKFAIKNALKNSDAPRNNKIVFDTDEPQQNTGRSQLFDDDEDADYSNDFRSKKQFEGEHGQKLLELKTKFKNDDRFQMDEDFLEGESHAPVETEDNQGERQRQLEILGSVVGKSFDTKKKKSTLPPTMLRFDPTKATHQKFYKQSMDDGVDDAMDTTEDVDVPKVSSDQFYKVSNNIGQTIQGESQGFSLLKMMGHDADDGAQAAGQGGYYAEPIEQRHKKQNYNDNPFKYDSSDDESGAKKKKLPPSSGQEKPQQQAKKVGGKTNKRGIFRENFFILPGDARLEQGLAFFQAGPRDKTRNFQEIKKNLKKVVSKKVKKNKNMQKANFGRKVFKPKK